MTPEAARLVAEALASLANHAKDVSNDMLHAIPDDIRMQLCDPTEALVYALAEKILQEYPDMSEGRRMYLCVLTAANLCYGYCQQMAKDMYELAEEGNAVIDDETNIEDFLRSLGLDPGEEE